MALILIIDDEAHLRGLLRQMLESSGHKVEEGKDGLEGLMRARAMRPDLIITDILMPKKEGFETIPELRKEFPQVPLLVMSGVVKSALYLRMATMLGAHGVLAKPFSLTQLRNAVDGLLAGSASLTT